MSAAASSDYVVSQRVGEAVITIISDGWFLGPPYLELPEAEWRPDIPEADAAGLLHYGFNMALVQLGDAVILIDPTGIDDPTSAMYAIRTDDPSFTSTPGLQTALAGLGFSPEAITHVLITHAHDDHFCGVTTVRDGHRVVRFPRARYFIGRGDWDNAPDRDNELVRCLRPIEELGLLEIIDEEREVVPGVAMIPTPGETPGHCVVCVGSGRDRFYYLGDLFFYPAHVEHPEWVGNGRDAVIMPVTRRHVSEDVAANMALLVFTHAPFPGLGRIVATAEGYRWKWASSTTSAPGIADTL